VAALSAALAVAAGGLALAPVTGSAASTRAPRVATAAAAATATSRAHSLPPIKHVWLIILENKSYDAAFTGLNDNTYLWKTLPRQGALLTNYYGTGHYSLDIYPGCFTGHRVRGAGRGLPPRRVDCRLRV